MKNTTLHISGMSCGHCLNAVNQAIAAVPGTQVKLVRMGRAEVEYDESQTTPALIAAAVQAAGYDAVVQ